MLEEDTKSLNEIKALVETYQGFSLLYFANKTISIMREWKKFTIKKGGNKNGFSPTLLSDDDRSPKRVIPYGGPNFIGYSFFFRKFNFSYYGRS